MADYLLNLAKNPFARRMVKRLGLPVPMPTSLRRADGPWARLPLADHSVAVAGAPGGILHGELATALVGAGGSVHFFGEEADRSVYLDAGTKLDRPVEARDKGSTPDEVVPNALVFDASGIANAGELIELYEFFHGWVGRLKTSGRALVVARSADSLAKKPEAAAAQTALEGFIRALGKELGKRGSTAQLVTVDKGAEGRVGPVVRWLLSRRSAFVSGQVVRVTKTAKGALEPVWERPLEGKLALVTGAARGIGEAIAEALAAEGAHVIALDREETDSPLDAVAARIGGTALHLDLTDDDAPRVIVERIQKDWDGLDIVAHNAGITRDKTLAKMSRDQWSLTLDVNLAAITRITPALLESVLNDDGRIICTASTSGIAGNFGQTNYSASKAGVIGYVRALAPKVAKQGITVNAVAPGFIETRMTAQMPVTVREAGRRLNALSQGGDPRDVAQVVTFLASPGAIGLTGSVVRVCGLSMVGA